MYIYFAFISSWLNIAQRLPRIISYFHLPFRCFFLIPALSSVDQYIYAHDTLAAAIECGHLHGVIQLRNGTLTHNGATHATSVDRMSEFSAHAV